MYNIYLNYIYIYKNKDFNYYITIYIGCKLKTKFRNFLKLLAYPRNEIKGITY